MSPRTLLALCAALSIGSSVQAAGKAADPLRDYRAKVKALPGLVQARQEQVRAQADARRRAVGPARTALSTLNNGTCRSWLCTLAKAASPQDVIDADYEQHAAGAVNAEQRGYDLEHDDAMERHADAMSVYERDRVSHQHEMAGYERDLSAWTTANDQHEAGKQALATWEGEVKAYDDALKAAQTARWGAKRRAQADAARARLGERPVKPIVPAPPGPKPTEPGEAPTAPKAPVRKVAAASREALAKAEKRRSDLRHQFPSYQGAANTLDWEAQRLGLTGRVGQLHNRSTSAADAIDGLQREVDALEAELEAKDKAALDSTDHVGAVREAGLALQRRITAKVRRDRATLDRRLKTAPPEELYEEALDLMQDAQDLSNTTSIRKETVATASGESSSYGGSSRTARAGGRDGRGGSWGAAEDESSWSESHSSWRSERRQLLLDAEVLTMGVSPAEREHRQESELTLPEARLVVEKVLRAQQLYRALVKRDPQLAANIQRWMQHSQIVIHYRPDPYRQGSTFTLQVRRLGPDLRALEKIGLIDADRAADLDDEADARLSEGL